MKKAFASVFDYLLRENAFSMQKNLIQLYCFKTFNKFIAMNFQKKIHGWYPPHFEANFNVKYVFVQFPSLILCSIDSLVFTSYFTLKWGLCFNWNWLLFYLAFGAAQYFNSLLDIIRKTKGGQIILGEKWVAFRKIY